MKKRCFERKVFFRQEWLNPSKDKAMRGRAFQARSSMGMVVFPAADIPVRHRAVRWFSRAQTKRQIRCDGSHVWRDRQSTSGDRRANQNPREAS